MYKKTFLILIAISIIINKWTLGFILSSDGKIELPLFINAIILFQVVTILLAIYILYKKPHLQLPSKSNIALCIFSMSICLLFTEIAARFWLKNIASEEAQSKYRLYSEIPKNKLMFSPHHYLNYIPTPNYSKGLTKHNSLGYRGDEFPLEKPENEFRIVTIGGSTTYTTSVKDNKKTYPVKLEQILKNQYNHKNIKVINAGAGGYSSWESLINFQFRVLDLDPDMIIIYHGTNDVHPRLVDSNFYKGDNSGKIKRWAAPHIKWYDKISLFRIFRRKFGISHKVALRDFVNTDTYYGAKHNSEKNIQAKDRFELLKKNPPIYFKRNISNIIHIAQARKIKVILATWAYSPLKKGYSKDPAYQKGFAENNNIIQQISNELNVPLLDFAKIMPNDKKYWKDGRHLNEKGALLKAKMFAEFLNEKDIITKPKSNP